MPKFPVSFGKRKSAVPKEDGDVVPSFRVLERSDAVGVKTIDGNRGTSRPISTARPYSQADFLAEEENMFAGLNANRGSGSSNTTKTASTDTSSRHSAVSTAPSSAAPPADLNHHQHPEKPYSDIPLPPPPKSSGFLNRAGRTFSFGNTKKSTPPVPAPEVPPPVPAHDPSPRARRMTSSTTSTATPPKLNDEQFSVDLGDFGTMFKGFDKRASVATVRDEAPRGMPPRSLTGNRVSAGHLVPPQTNSPAPQPQQPRSPHSVNSDHSNDGLLNNERSLPPPAHSSSYNQKNTRSSNSIEYEDASLLRQSVAASKSLGDSGSGVQSGRYRRSENAAGSKAGEDDNMFDNTFIKATRAAQRYVSRPPSPPRNRVMTAAQFERFKQEKERTATQSKNKPAQAKDEDDEEEEDYEDDEDEVEKSKQAAKQRRKQEAHMTVYRQQMMKVTGESANPPPRQSFATTAPVARTSNTTDGSDEDEEIPLAILAAHGFPAKNRAPSRLSTVGSNPNLRASMGGPTPPPQPSRASTLALGEHPGQASGSRASQLPAFARRLPQDPFVGAGLVRNPARESMAMGGGAPPAPQGSLPPGGLVGVIASEERSRAMRRGSPHVMDGKLINNVNGTPGLGVDPMAQMMYGMGNPSAPHLGGMGFQQPPSLTPGDQAQIQMTQQMQQFMQMQMQFMQMMAGNQGAGGARPNSFVGGSPMGDMPSRQSYIGTEYPPEGRPMMNEQMRTMSMVQPSSGSWVQPMPGYAPSIRVQGEGYAPSIAPSERSNIGLPGRYRPVSHVPTVDPLRRASTMTGALGSWDDSQKPRLAPSPTPPAKSGNQSDEDDEEGWAAMKEKREKKKSLWKSKKGFGKELSALIS